MYKISSIVTVIVADVAVHKGNRPPKTEIFYIIANTFPLVKCYYSKKHLTSEYHNGIIQIYVKDIDEEKYR